MNSKVNDLKSAINMIDDYAAIAIGGSTYGRHPIAAIHEVVRQHKRNLSVYGWSNDHDIDVLLSGGCLREIQSFYESNKGDKDMHSAKKHGTRYIEQPKDFAISRFQAGATGTDFSIIKDPFNSLKQNEYTKQITCPFTNNNYIALKAFKPDVAIIHAHFADRHGNVVLNQNRVIENDVDFSIAKSANYTIVTVEQIVSEESIKELSETGNILYGEFVDVVVEAPFGAYPTSCDSFYTEDKEFLNLFNKRTKTSTEAIALLEEYIYGKDNWSDFLNKVGIRKLLSLGRKDSKSGNYQIERKASDEQKLLNSLNNNIALNPSRN